MVLANSLVQLLDDFDINAAYLLTVEIDTVGLRLKINGTLYASLPYVMVRNANDSLSGVSAIDDRRSYPGTGGAVAQGGVDSMRLATLVPPPNPPFWGRFKGTVETP